MKKIIVCAVVLAAAFSQARADYRRHIDYGDTTRVINIEEVTVIATPKENARLRQQPLSATSLSLKEMKCHSVGSVKALSALIPNVFIPDYGSKLTTSIYVRGIGSRINTPAIGLYVDNIPFIDKSAFDFNYSDIERIDVLRGPQGTLYGRNTMGGLIRIFTKSPFSYQGTDLDLSVASDNLYKLSLSHYHRISKQFAFSANFFYQHNGGFFKNTLSDKTIDKNDEFGGRMRAIILPHENLRLDFTLNYEYVNQGGYPYAYTGIINGQENRAEHIGRISYNHECGYKRNLLNAGANIEYQSENFILSSVTGFQYLYDRMDLDQDFTEKDIYTMMQKQNSKSLSQEIVLKSKPDKRWQWTTGISSFYQWLTTEAPVTFRRDGLAMINGKINAAANSHLPEMQQGPMHMKFMFNDTISGETMPIDGTFDTPVFNASLFHQSAFHDLFGLQGLSFTAGLRLDYENLELDYRTGCRYSHVYSLNGHLTSQRPPMDKVIPMVREQTFENKLDYDSSLAHDYWQLLPKFSLQYDFNADNNVYLTISRGYRSGGFNIQMFSDLLQNDLRTAGMKDVADVTIPIVNGVGMIDQPTKDKITGILQSMSARVPMDIREMVLYKPEYSWNYEAGSHLTLWDGRVQTDMAVFYMRTRDQQIARFAKSGLGRITVNAGKSRSLGAEATVRTRITDALSLNGSYGYTYATFTNYVMDEEKGENCNGNYVPFVPKHTMSVGGQYIFTLKHNRLLDNIIYDINYKAAGRIYWTEQNNASQHFYGTLNSRLAFNKGKAQLALWINNALDKDYQAFYFESMNRGFAQQGRPLQFGIDLRCNF